MLSVSKMATATTVNVKLSRSNRIYRSSEPVEGKIVIKSATSISHQAIRLSVNGSVNLQVRGGSAGVIESFYGVIKPIQIVKKTIEVKSSGKIPPGTTEIPFSLNLREPGEGLVEKFYETFHGTNINIQYLLTADIPRGYLHKPLSATMEFIIESGRVDLPERPIPPEIVIFYITQDTQRHPLLPDIKTGGFRVTGKLATQCSLQDPLSGERIVTETSLIQSTQIADGDVCRNMTLPIYVLLPRLLMCPSVFAGPFSVEFKVCITISFKSKLAKAQPKSDPTAPRLWMALERLPLELVRTKRDQFSC
ncbi:unnamed protein product [Arabidopsis thaliana]|uniref:Vacuolar protein sorting-associated protein 26C n=1 Tax=Arabidopsis thaliana TaxID=3702 RepID=A0A7G2DZ76_ARATH|nr:unnamed protein product [Arabidopsis thaliana]